MQPREPLYDRKARLARRRALSSSNSFARRTLPFLAVLLLIGLAGIGYTPHEGDLYSLRLHWTIIIGVTVLLLTYKGYFFISRARQWRSERDLSVKEMAECGRADGSRVGGDSARIQPGDYPGLDRALDLYQASVGTSLGLQLERLPIGVYGTKADACARIDRGKVVLCLTPALLRGFTPSELLAVLAHLVHRGEQLTSAKPDSAYNVREADAGTLMLTHDHAALVSAIEKTRAQNPPGLAKPDDAEAWFSEDDLRVRGADAEGWTRIDRLAELQEHLGALGLPRRLSKPRIPTYEPPGVSAYEWREGGHSVAVVLLMLVGIFGFFTAAILLGWFLA